MSTKPTDSQELKLGPGWTSLSKNPPTHHPPPSISPSPAPAVPTSAPPRISYTKAELLDLYQPHSTSSIPATMSEYPGITSNEPLIPVNIAPDDTLSHVSVLPVAPEPATPRPRFPPPTPRPGVEAILGRDNPHPSLPQSSNLSETTATSTTSAKKPGHVSQSNRDFWSASAVLAAAERPTTSTASERRPLSLKPRTTSAARAASPNGHAEKSSQPYWARGAARGTADSKSNWRGGALANSAVASGGAKYPGASADELTAGTAVASHSSSARKSTSDLMSGFGNPSNRPGFSRDTGLFGRNHKEALKPTNTRDLSALAKGSNRDSTVSSYAFHHDKDSAREPRVNPQEDAAQIKPQTDNAEKDKNLLWYYRDPQGNTQGPFVGSQLLQWEKEGYYDSELPVSTNADHGFKPLAVAFGLREEEPCAAAPPPGFVNASSPKNITKASSPTLSRPSREERTKRGTRTVEEMAEEVEMMRLQARNKRNSEKAATEAAGGGQFDTEKSFFDGDSSVTEKANGHHVMHDQKVETEHVHESEKADLPAKTSPEKNSHVHNSSAVSAPPANDVRHEQPSKQSRFASLMKQDADPISNKNEVHVANNDMPNDSRAISHHLQSSKVAPSFPIPLKSESAFDENIAATPPDRVKTKPRENDESVSWNAMMVGLQQHQQVSTQQQLHVAPQPQQQRNGPPAIPSMPLTASDQELMAIDPAIAHASFAQPVMHTSSPAPTPRVSGSELPPWLRLSNGMETSNVLQQMDALQDPSLSIHPVLQAPLNAHIPPHDQAHLQARFQVEARAQAEARAQEARVQAEVHARAEAMRQAQVKAQVQAQVQARQIQAQHQARAVQHASALAQAQTQQPNSAQEVWMLKHQIVSLQRNYDVHYRRLAEMTRTSQAAQAALNNSPAGSHEHQRARVLFTQAQNAGNEITLQLDRIKRAAETTNHMLMQAQAAAPQGQQFPLHSQSPQALPEPHESISPHSVGRPSIQSPKQLDGNGILHVESMHAMTPEAQKAPGMVGMGIGGVEHIDEGQNKVRRNLNSTYDNIVTSEAQGWETVGKKGINSMPDSAEPAHVDEKMRGASGEKRETARGDGIANRAAIRKATNDSFRAETKMQHSQVVESGPREGAAELGQATRIQNEAPPAVAPWSKAVASQTAANGLSLREIQRQEELRSKAEGRNAAAQVEREEAAKAAASRWNSGQPWGGAGDPSKQQTLSFKEKMRLEEEQKKKAALHSVREAIPAPKTAPSGTANRLGTKTGWASLVAKTSKQAPTRRPTATVVGKKMEEEAPFWESVSSQPQASTSNAARLTRPNFAQAASHGPPAAVQVRKPAVKPPVPAVPTRRASANAKAGKSDTRDSSTSESLEIGGRLSHEFENWCVENLQKLTGIDSQDTILFQYLVTLKSQNEIRDTLLQNLGSNDKTQSFADEFIRRLEFDRNSVVADAGAGGTSGRKKGRRHRAAKVDPSLVLGFTSTSSRIMQGTIETPEMK